jgi:hypothetical protein
MAAMLGVSSRGGERWSGDPVHSCLGAEAEGGSTRGDRRSLLPKTVGSVGIPQRDLADDDEDGDVDGRRPLPPHLHPLQPEPP